MEGIESLTMKERMVGGFLYNANEGGLLEERNASHACCWKANQICDKDERMNFIRENIGIRFPKDKPLWIEAGFQCDYGWNIEVGADFYANFNCVILDCAKVVFGDNCLLGPNVQIYTATHPTDAGLRRQALEFAKPITVGNDCWIGGNATLLPGVVLGDRVIVGAGAVVTKSFPSDVVIGGNPAKIIKELENKI